MVPRRVILFLCVGLAGASQSGNIIRLGDAHPVSMTFWRLLLATMVLLPLAGRDLPTLRTLNRKERILLLLAGVMLAFHFFTWIAAVQLTTVANAAVFFSSNPILTAALAYLFFREWAGPRLFISIAMGLAGVVIISGGDLCFTREHLAGDGMAMLSALLFTIYFLLGKKLRAKIPTTAYVTAIYGTAALVSLPFLLFFELPAFDYSPKTWLSFVLLALIPTLLGHTSINNALRYISAGKIAVATMSEPLLAGLVAYAAWNEVITLQTAMGYILITLSVIFLVIPNHSPTKHGEAQGGP